LYFLIERPRLMGKHKDEDEFIFADAKDSEEKR
jgi:hypothetical protein